MLSSLVTVQSQNNRIVIDARMNEIYTRTFSYNNGKYNLGNIELLDINSNFIEFETFNQNNAILLSDIQNYKYNSYYTNAHALGLLSLVYNNLDYACEVHQIKPNYIRNKVANTITERAGRII